MEWTIMGKQSKYLPDIIQELNHICEFLRFDLAGGYNRFQIRQILKRTLLRRSFHIA
jgi:hypothetical protein